MLGRQRGREAYALLRDGALNGLSIGFRTEGRERAQERRRVLKELDLVEISLVSLPGRWRGPGHCPYKGISQWIR